MSENNITGLRLSVDSGWTGKSIDFLTRLPNLLYLAFANTEIADVTPINTIHNLRRLELIYHCRAGLDLSAMPHLTRLHVYWNKPTHIEISKISLAEAYFCSPPRSMKDSLFMPDQLQILTLANTTLDGDHIFNRQQNLKFLRLAYIRGLADCNYFRNLGNLEEIYIQSCKGFNDISPLSSLPNLKRLYLCNAGNIESLEPLRGNKTLECFGLSDNTRIVNGDLSILDTIPNLQWVQFGSHRRYNRKNHNYPKELGWKWMA